jgi:hypothetical protein
MLSGFMWFRTEGSAGCYCDGNYISVSIKDEFEYQWECQFLNNYSGPWSSDVSYGTHRSAHAMPSC